MHDNGRTRSERPAAFVGIAQSRRVGRDFDVERGRCSGSVMERDGAHAGESPPDPAGADDFSILVCSGVPALAHPDDVSAVIGGDVDGVG
jgi:hypothetical protein